MWKTKFVLVLVVAYVLGSCQGASVAQLQSNMRLLGSMNRYLVDTWNDTAEISNDAAGIAAQTILTGDTQRVVVLVHGRETTRDFALRLREAFLNEDTTRTTAVVRLEWGAMTNLGYDFAVSAVPYVADNLADFIAALDAATQLNRNLLHIVGFDLGAHVAGIASRRADARAVKITGLDPAGASWGPNSDRLTGTDADSVEVIHTDGVGNRAYGIGEDLGGLNFFPNGGTRQPGCANSNNLCHHNRAWELFAATLEVSGNHLTGLQCVNIAQVTSNRCTGAPATMGTAILDKRGSGIYRLTTGRVWPY